ncbi:MAG TPA: MFS transporter, partial [Candidatus Acidoferrales bacterium]|nr:MFS transporter [Candidatus Acidoferrales bacterium]
MSSDAPRAGWTDNFRALRHRNFRLYWTGQLISLVGTWMQSVAQAWLMHRITDSAFMLGLLGFVQFLPVLPLSLHAGAIADRVDKKKLLLVTQSVLTVQAVAFAIVAQTGRAKPWSVLVLALVYGVANAFDMPARQSFVIEMVGREDLANGIALNSAAFNVARIGGPALGGLLLAGVGESGCFWLNAVSFLAVIASLVMMRLPPRVRAAHHAQPIGANLRDGVQYAWRTGSIR